MPEMKQEAPRLGRALWLGAAVLSAGIALFSYRYLTGGGSQSAAVLSNLYARPWLHLHIAGAATALLLGSFQFLPRLRRIRSAHRWIGRIYVVGCLTGAAAGLPLALGSSAGSVAALGFGGLSVVWFGVNVLGWRAAALRRFSEHRAWMVRSWSLTLAAVTLRLYLPLLPLLHVSFLDGYRAVSFLAWIPNLLLAEGYLAQKASAPLGSLGGDERRNPPPVRRIFR